MSDRVHCRTCQTDVIVTSTAMFCQCEHARDRHLQLVAAPTTEEVERLRAENAALREALEVVAEKAGSHTVSQDAIGRGVDDHGFAGIFFVARNALEESRAALAKHNQPGDDHEYP